MGRSWGREGRRRWEDFGNHIYKKEHKEVICVSHHSIRILSMFLTITCSCMFTVPDPMVDK
jgi:broad specificity phosphatase PhoE